MMRKEKFIRQPPFGILDDKIFESDSVVSVVQ